MAKQTNWKEPFSDTETKEEALIRMYNEQSSGTPGTFASIAATFGVSVMAINKKLGGLRNEGKIGYKEVVNNHTDLKQRVKGAGFEWTENVATGSASLEVVDPTYFEIEEALRHAHVDENIWEIKDFKRGFWTTPIAPRVANGLIITHGKVVNNYYIRINFTRKKSKNVEMAWSELMKDIPKFQYSATPPVFTGRSGVALEIAPVDAHFAKLAWDAETGRGDYDLNIAVKNYDKVMSQNLAWGSVFKPEKIFFIVGNDLMHAENYEGVTPSAKNILDIDSRLPRLIKAAMEINIKAVYRCRSVAPVEVIWIPGNHDPTSSLWLCHTLDQHFKDDKFVTVDVTPGKRKARLWGNLLVGWTHSIVGRHNSWANELAQAFPTLWGKSKFREWHHGDKHKKSEVKTNPVVTQGGVLMRQLTALSPIDAWHFEHLYTDAVPGSESFLWSKDRGVFSNFVAWL